MSKNSGHLYEFGHFRLDPTEQQLLRDGQPIALTPKAFDTLVMLVERSGRLVEKDELLKALWPDSFVEEANLTNNIWALRKALDENGGGQGYIVTVPKRGYRFIADVKEWPQTNDELIVEKHSFTRIVTQEDAQTTVGPVSTLATLTAEPTLSRRVGIVVVTLCILGAVVLGALFLPRTLRSTRTTEADTGAPLKSIAVLPFKIIGSDANNEYLGLGLSDALITKLGNEHRIVVRPTSAVRRYTDANQDPVTIGRQQKVDAVLDGHVQQSGDRLRLTVQLIRVADGVTIWSEHFDEKFTNIFSVQDSISDQVACDLVTRICGSDSERLKKQQTNVDAYQAYMKGRYFWNKRTAEGFKKAIEYFNQAIESDATYAPAYVGLADSYLLLGGYGSVSQTETVPKASAAAKKAIELDGTLADPHATLGLIAMNYDYDWRTSEQEYKRAIELNPNYTTAHHWYGEYLSALGRFDEASAEFSRAHELDPLSLMVSTDTAKMLYFSRRYDEAIEQLRKVLEMDPHFQEAVFWLSYAYAMKGRYEEALEEYKTIGATRSMPDEVDWLINSGYFYASAGRKAEAQKALENLKEISKHRYVDSFPMAVINIALGDRDQAFHWLEKSYGEHNAALTSLKVNPIYDSLRSDPRFADLMRRVGLS